MSVWTVNGRKRGASEYLRSVMWLLIWLSATLIVLKVNEVLEFAVKLTNF